MSDSPASTGHMKYRNEETRIRVALSKYYGMGSDGEWSIDEIADYLNCSEKTVEKYLYQSEIAQQTEGMLAEAEAQTRMQLLEDMHNQLDALEHIQGELMQKKEAVPTSYQMVKTEAEIDPSDEHNLDVADDGGNIDVRVPVPKSYAEVTDTEELTDIWRERRLIREQMEDLLGLEAPEEIETNNETTIDVKHWEVEGGNDSDDALPDQDVIDIESNTVEMDDNLPEQDIDDA